MPRGLRNWIYRDLVNFLKTNNFKLYKQKEGSHEAWINFETEKIVEINFHTSKSFPPRTLETMIRQSGIPKKEWHKWTKSKK
jgi:predicted RNA binding protein YcfA (HicA-like mRNA interferase family)